MNPFFCIHCSRTSFFDERFHCIHCGNRAYLAAVNEVLNFQIPETESLIPENYAPTSDSGNEKNEEYCFQLVQPCREASTQMFEEGSNVPLKITGSDGYENCSKNVCDSPRVNETAEDYEHYPNANQNCFPSNKNTNEGQFQIQSYYIVNDAASLRVFDDTAEGSQETCLFEQISVGEGENKNNSDEMLGCQGIKETTEHTKRADNLVFTDPITFQTEYKVVNLFSDSSDNAEDRQDQDKTTPSCSSFPRGNSSVNKCYQQILVTAKTVARQKSQSSSKLSKRSCRMCGKYFMREWTFYAHKEYCNSAKQYACRVCDKTLRNLTDMFGHERLHNREKPFKSTQCNYATAWISELKNHAKMHTNLSPSFSSSRRNLSGRKYFQELLVKANTEAQQKSQPCSKLQNIMCPKCKKYFRKEERLVTHVESNCNPNPYKCEQCAERFPHEYSLIQHKRVHTGEKPFQCNQCDYAAAQ